MAVYVGAENGVARKAAEVFVGVDGVARRAKRVYVGDAQGKARLGFEQEWDLADTFTAQISMDVQNRYESWTVSRDVIFKLNAASRRYSGYVTELTITSISSANVDPCKLSGLPEGVKAAMTSWRVKWSQTGTVGLGGAPGTPWVGTVYIETK